MKAIIDAGTPGAADLAKMLGEFPYPVFASFGSPLRPSQMPRNAVVVNQNAEMVRNAKNPIRILVRLRKSPQDISLPTFMGMEDLLDEEGFDVSKLEEAFPSGKTIWRGPAASLTCDNVSDMLAAIHKFKDQASSTAIMEAMEGSQILSVPAAPLLRDHAVSFVGKNGVSTCGADLPNNLSPDMKTHIADLANDALSALDFDFGNVIVQHNGKNDAEVLGVNLTPGTQQLNMLRRLIETINFKK